MVRTPFVPLDASMSRERVWLGPASPLSSPGTYVSLAACASDQLRQSDFVPHARPEGFEAVDLELKGGSSLQETGFGPSVGPEIRVFLGLIFLV